MRARPATIDPGYRKRLGIAIALSLAVHEIVAGLWPNRPAPPRSEPSFAPEVVTIARRSPPPTPVPTPKMTPPPHYTFAPVVAVRAPAARAAATPHAALGGAAAPKRPVVLRPRVRLRPAPPVSLVAGTHLGLQNGGSGTGAGAGNGTSGQSGAGTGSAAAGAGNAGNANSGPCGEVQLLPGSVSYRPDGTVLQNVIAKVILRDGDVELGKFPYPFIYGAERLNPFVHDDQLEADKGVRVQAPPPGLDPTTFPPIVQTVLKFTNPATGFTTLPDCAGTSPAPLAAPATGTPSGELSQ